jgi:hypothetical protein
MLIDTESLKSRKITTTLACNARSKKRDNELARCQVDSDSRGTRYRKKKKQFTLKSKKKRITY